jgi:thiol-disulfide isomerase/thioredoxin
MVIKGLSRDDERETQQRAAAADERAAVVEIREERNHSKKKRTLRSQRRVSSIINTDFVWTRRTVGETVVSRGEMSLAIMASTYFFFIFFLICLSSFDICKVAATSQTDDIVQVVNSSNAHQFLSNKRFVVEFYAPWCRHCQLFQESFNQVGQKLSERGFAVGKVDASTNAALSARFDVIHIPTIFLYRNGALWRYSGNLNTDAVVEFATEGFKTTTPLPLTTSPMGPLGLFKGLVMRAGVSVMDILKLLTKSFGLSEWASYLLIVGGLATIIIVITLVGVLFSLGEHHYKNE